MRELVLKHKKGYVSIDKLLNFNRIKLFFINANINTDKERRQLLVSSIQKNSKLLYLNKKKDLVKRLVSFDQKLLKDSNFNHEVEKRTIYVENLPEIVNHETVYSIFCKYGKILFISLPKNKNNTNKGYAFVEFEVINFFI